MLQLLLPLLFWVVSKQRQLLGPISVVHRCRRLRVRSSFTTEAKKQKPAWTCGVVLYTSTHYSSNSVTQLWLASARFIVVVQVSINSNSLLQPSVEFFFFPSDENRNDFRLLLSSGHFSFLLAPFLITYRKIDLLLLLLVDHFPSETELSLFPFV